MRDFKYTWAIGLVVTALIIIVPSILFITGDQENTGDPNALLPSHPQPTDHSTLLNDEYETGSAVTRACLNCHEDAAAQVMGTTHWTWQTPPTEVDWRDEPVAIGKSNLLNNFCIGIQSNWSSCTRCHAGYGWESADYDFNTAENVDCLVCHDQSGLYVKSAAGQPAEGVDLLTAARSVGIPTRENCGTCHFNGGGGNAVKHGDMDETLYFPTEHVDVHMGRYDFLCTDCHRTHDHDISGRALSVSADNNNQIACTDCHESDLHSDERINAHTETVACQTCHIPAGAVRDATKMEWDWASAGDETREEDAHEYLRIKGSFVYEAEFIPDYSWSNGTVDYRYLLGDEINPNEITVLNPPGGTIDDPNAQIWPFKVHRATQIYDSEYNWLIQPQTTGEEGYWTQFDWNRAAELGMEAVGLPYSGEYGFAPTEMYWSLSHMVMPSEHALQCTDCHGESTRFNWEALGYYGDPMNWGGRNIDELAAYLEDQTSN